MNTAIKPYVVIKLDPRSRCLQLQLTQRWATGETAGRGEKTRQPVGRQRSHRHGRAAPALAQTQPARPLRQLQPGLHQLAALPTSTRWTAWPSASPTSTLCWWETLTARRRWSELPRFSRLGRALSLWWVSLHRFDCPAVRITKGFQRLSVTLRVFLLAHLKGKYTQKTILSFSHTQVVPVRV